MKITNDEGQEMEVYTDAEKQADIAAAVAAAKAEADAIIAAKEAEIGTLKKVSAEKTENFRKYNEMTEAEKAAYDANTVELMKRNDKTAEQVAELTARLAEKEASEKQYTKNSVLKTYYGDKEDIKASIEEKYALLAAMPENTPAEIQERAKAAATLAGISINSVNPIYQGFNGEAPSQSKVIEYADSATGKEAADMLRAELGIKSN